MITRILTLIALLCSLSVTSQAQVSLSSLANEANASWMFGKWSATTDNGSTVHLEISWQLEKNMVVLDIKTDDMEAKGYTVLEPGAELPSYLGADNRGSVSKGSWNYEDGALVLRLETSRPYESPRKWASVFSGSESSGLTIRMHGLESWGGLSYPATATLKFKKQ